MNKMAMHEALKRKKAQGLDVAIILNPHGDGVESPSLGDGDEEMERKELGLAPDAPELKDPSHSPSEMDMEHKPLNDEQELENHPDADQSLMSRSLSGHGGKLAPMFHKYTSMGKGAHGGHANYKKKV